MTSDSFLLLKMYTAFSLTPQTAIAPDDYIDPGAININFVDGEVVKQIAVTLQTDALVEGIEYFQAELGAITVADTDQSTVDAELNTANIFILDLTCKYLSIMYSNESKMA